MSTLNGSIAHAKQEIWSDPESADDLETLGILVSKHCEWSLDKLAKVFEAALEPHVERSDCRDNRGISARTRQHAQSIPTGEQPMKPTILKLKRIPFEDVLPVDEVCQVDHYRIARYRNEDGRPIMLCAPGVEDFFDIDPTQDVEIVIQTEEPRFQDFYKITSDDDGRDSLWSMHPRGGRTSPWTWSCDCLFSRVLRGHTVAYISAYQGG